MPEPIKFRCRHCAELNLLPAPPAPPAIDEAATRRDALRMAIELLTENAASDERIARRVEAWKYYFIRDQSLSNFAKKAGVKLSAASIGVSKAEEQIQAIQRTSLSKCTSGNQKAVSEY